MLSRAGIVPHSLTLTVVVLELTGATERVC